MTRLADARTNITTQPALMEYRARMGCYLDSALTLIAIAGEDALSNISRNPDDGRTKQVLSALATATAAIEPLVALMCPLTATARENADG